MITLVIIAVTFAFFKLKSNKKQAKSLVSEYNAHNNFMTQQTSKEKAIELIDILMKQMNLNEYSEEQKRLIKELSYKLADPYTQIVKNYKNESALDNGFENFSDLYRGTLKTHKKDMDIASIYGLVGLELLTKLDFDIKKINKPSLEIKIDKDISSLNRILLSELKN
ncbi:hypothetical protein AAG747_05055 [Rapidithrix thailandica]|uniref:Uncharacterized protein n=1 Tax=Rapidithrix thailandica TaxID=413964 RepID=A0AAW9S4H9_9BACT